VFLVFTYEGSICVAEWKCEVTECVFVNENMEVKHVCC